MKFVLDNFGSSRWRLLVGISLVVSTAMLISLIYKISVIHGRVEQALNTKVELGRMLHLTLDAETAARGYALTGDVDYLKPLVDSRLKMNESVSKSRRLLNDVVGISHDSNKLFTTVVQRIDFAETAAKQFEIGTVQPDNLLLLSRGKTLQDEIRSLASSISDDLQNYVVHQQNELRNIIYVLVGSVMLSCLFFYSLWLLWSRTLSQRELAREHLIRAEATYTTAFNHASVGMILLSADGVLQAANDSYAKMLDTTVNNLLGSLISSQILPRYRESFELAFKSIVEKERAVTACDVMFNKPAGAVCGQLTLSTFGVGAEAANILVLIQETTKDIQRLQKIRKYEMLMQNASRLAGFHGWSLELPGYNFEANELMYQMLGVLSFDMTPRSVIRMLRRDSRSALLRGIKLCRQSGQSFEVEAVVIRDGAPSIYLDIMGQPVYAQGEIIAIEGAVRDVTLVNEQHRKVACSEARFKAVARVTNDAIWELDLERLQLWHNQSKEVRGQEYAAKISVNEWLDAIHSDDREGMVDSFKRSLYGGDDTWSHEFRYIHTNGEEGIIESHAAFLRDVDGVAHHVVGGAQDLTRRRRMQAAMMNMAASVAGIEDEQFFTVLLRNLIQGLEADGGCIAKFAPQQSDIATTLAVVVDGCLVENFSYTVHGTPCENLLHSRECFIPDDLSRHFPDASDIAGLKARAYIGGQLLDAQGVVIGFIYLLYREPLVRLDFMTSVLQVFAVRAAAEIRRIQADQILREQAELLDHAREAIVVMDLDLRVRFWNRGAEHMYGVTKLQAIGHKVSRFYVDEHALVGALNDVLHAELVNKEFEQIKLTDGTTMRVEESWTLIREEGGGPRSILKVGSDITEKRLAEEQIKNLAYYDTLTGLPNRRLFMDRLSNARAEGSRLGRHCGLLFIDLDNFKSLNDLHGHLKGDEFLVAVAALLMERVRRGDTVARLGGDEFVIILEGLDSDPARAIAQASQVASSLLASFSKPLYLGDLKIYGTASIGVTIFMDKGCQLDELLRQADLAMYEAKDFGRNAFRVFNPALGEITGGKSELVAELRHALDNCEFELWYQPQYALSTVPYGTEALLRWRHPSKGMISPAEFIPLAERSGFIVELGKWVLDQACRQLADWAADPDLRHLVISVNVSVQQVRQDDFASQVLSALAMNDARPDLLVLELTESILDEKFEGIAQKLHSLRSAGVHISLDDFGTGYSSLSRLRQLPFDEMKIDRTFIKDVPTDHDAAAIVEAIITLGRTMRMRVVAEGVEGEEQMVFLKEHGCEAFQGFYFAHPMQPEALKLLVSGEKKTATESLE